MKKNLLLALGFGLLAAGVNAQTVSQRLQKAFGQFEADSQLRHAISSLYVIDANTGEVVFDKNSQVGLAGASTQKIITAATAFELLGKDYTYKTEFWMTERIKRFDDGLVIIKPSGDPTFGSWRYATSKPEYLFRQLEDSFKKIQIPGSLLIYHNSKIGFDDIRIPDRWIWQDIGNYYGAGAGAFNWKENQTDITLSAGANPGDSVKILEVDSSLKILRINNQLLTGPRNSGDNAYYYFSYGNETFIRPILSGTIPAGESKFKISIAIADPYALFINDLRKRKLASGGRPPADFFHTASAPIDNKLNKLIYTHYSPPLDSIIYWFLKKSINLYGEALVKTFAYEKQGFGSTDSGVSLVKKFWKEKGLDEEELNMYDGSGLSPMNRITTHAQVEILKYARTRPWYQSFYYALPEYNGMKVKSGTIGDVKGFCGYHKAKDGKEYIFSFLVNNYSGRTSPVVNKMYKVLDELK